MIKTTNLIKRCFGLIGLAVILACFCLPLTEISAQVISMGANGTYGTSMAVCKDGNVQMWGGNASGEEGTNFAPASGNSFVIVLTGEDSASCPTNLCNIKAVADGTDYNSYALDNAGHVWSWGYCQFANLGNGSDNVVGCSQGTPVEVKTSPASPLKGITTISAGFNDCFGIDSIGNLWGWGFNSQYGDIGNNTTNDVPYAVQVHGVGNVGYLTGVSACSGGYSFSLAVGAGGAVYGWGLNNCGQNGSGYPQNFFYPVQVETSLGYLTHCIAVAAGFTTSYALDDSGHVWTWGLDADGEGGVNHNDNAPSDGGGSSNNLAVQVGSGGCGGGALDNIVAIAAGWTNAYALDKNGHVWAWGFNRSGECGNGNNIEQPCPVEVLTGPGTPLDSVVAIAGSSWEAMALRSNGVIYTWGYNSGGQLGNSTPIGDSSLYAAPMTPGYCTIAACSLYSLSISSTNSSVCQGDSATLSVAPIAVGSAPVKYLWFPGGQTSQSVRVAPSMATTYIVTVNDTIGGCFKMDSVRINIDTPPVVTLSGNKTTCKGDTVTITSNGGTTYNWSTGKTTSSIIVTVLSDTTYTVSIGNGTCTKDTTFNITVNPDPPQPNITQPNGHDTLYCSTDPSYSSYQWYDSATIINGATDTFLVVTHSGNYNVQVSNENGCTIGAGTTVIIGIKNYVSDNFISLSPNPVTSELLISGNWQSAKGKMMITIFNLLGEIIYEKELNPARAGETVNCNPFPSGIYFLQLKTDNGNIVKRFVKE